MSQPSILFVDSFRKGLANEATTTNGSRTSIQVDVEIEASGIGTPRTETASQQVSLLGAGDVVGFSKDLIYRHEPRPEVTDFEPNQFAFIEFYEPDLPWRFSTQSDGSGLIPWIALIVLTEEEFSDQPGVSPLPRIVLTNNHVSLPIWNELRYFTHVQLNETDDVASALANDSASATSRLICPRRLSAKTRYHAFLVPAYEVGRQAGLGRDITASANAPSWGNSVNGQEFPYYDRWSFITGAAEDFESLARLLKPFKTPPKVGFQKGDFSDPGFELPGPSLAPEDQLAVGGAMQSPAGEMTNWPGAGADPFRQALPPVINEPEGVDEEPVLAPPLYGRWHARQNAGNPEDRTGWFNHLNFDPRLRVAAGLGAEVVRRHQDRFMGEAWRQLGEVLRANQIIGAGTIGRTASRILYRKRILSLPQDQQLGIIGPVARRIVTGAPGQPQNQTKGKALETALGHGYRRPSGTEQGLRKVFRPRGPLGKRFNESSNNSHISWDTATGVVDPIAPRSPLQGAAGIGNNYPAPTPPLDKTGSQGSTQSTNGFLKFSWTTTKWFLCLLIIIILLTLLFFALALIPGIREFALILACIFLCITFLLLYLRNSARADASASDPRYNPVGGIGTDLFNKPVNAPNFIPSEPNTTNAVSGTTGALGNRTSPEADLLITAHNEWAEIAADTQISEPPAALSAQDIGALIDESVEKLNPAWTIPARTTSRITVSEEIWPARDRLELLPIMAHPEFKDVTSKLLADLAPSRLVPNIHILPRNVVSILEVNSTFIESFFVGLNHEMARELLWRGYPTDQRGSYFRRFWDRPTHPEGSAPDIEYIHRWFGDTALGSHPNPSEDSGQTIVSVRGDLLKKYPHTMVYLQQARFDPDSDATEQKKELVMEDEAILMPVFSTQINPDITFFGFDLPIANVRGSETDPGWYVVLAERPGETRFGLDFGGEGQGAFTDWQDFSWERAEGAGIVQNDILKIPDNISAISPSNPDDFVFGKGQSGGSAADVASILMQDPFQLAMHAEHLLAGGDGN